MYSKLPPLGTLLLTGTKANATHTCMSQMIFRVSRALHTAKGSGCCLLVV